MIQNINYKSKLLAVIIRSSFSSPGIHFFTPNEFSQQLAYMNRAKGYVISPHVHNKLPRQVTLTQEVLFVKGGKVRVDFYDDDRNYIESTIICTGDVILLAAGGHGFEMLEDSEMIEVKQGPYSEELDKIKFDPIDEQERNII